MATGGTEIYTPVARLDAGNTEAGVRTAISVKAEPPFGVVLDVRNVDVEVPQQLQGPLTVLVVPEDQIIILDGV